MKFYEYMTYTIIAFIVFDVVYRLLTYDWTHVSMGITALVGWFYVLGYERQERQERIQRESRQDQFTV